MTFKAFAKSPWEQARDEELKDVLAYLRGLIQKGAVRMCDECDDAALRTAFGDLEAGEHRGANTARCVRWNDTTRRYEVVP